jgi:hypothetical protein
MPSCTNNQSCSSGAQQICVKSADGQVKAISAVVRPARFRDAVRLAELNSLIWGRKEHTWLDMLLNVAFHIVRVLEVPGRGVVGYSDLALTGRRLNAMAVDPEFRHLSRVLIKDRFDTISRYGGQWKAICNEDSYRLYQSAAKRGVARFIDDEPLGLFHGRKWRAIEVEFAPPGKRFARPSVSHAEDALP